MPIETGSLSRLLVIGVPLPRLHHHDDDYSASSSSAAALMSLGRGGYGVGDALYRHVDRQGRGVLVVR